MRVLVLGGTGFIGAHVVRQLAAKGHDVAGFHRGQTTPELPDTVRQILGEYRNLSGSTTGLRRFRPDVIIDMIAATERDAQASIEVFRNVAGRMVVVSSVDVYRAFDVLNRIDQGPPQPVPIREEGELRRTLFPFRDVPSPPPDRPHDYEKILVERAYMGEPHLPTTILRLPMVYGPGDWRRHRTLPYVKRMQDGRKAILLEESFASWRATRGYVENVAAAIAAVVLDDRAAGQTYNVGEARAFTEREWVTSIGEATGWRGDVVVISDERMPDSLCFQGNAAQHWVMDTSRIATELECENPVAFPEGLRQTVGWQKAHVPPELPAGMFDYQAEDEVLLSLSGG